MEKQAGKCFDKNGMTDIHGGLPPGAGSETGEEGGIRWDHSQMIIVKFTNAIHSAQTLTGVAP